MIPNMGEMLKQAQQMGARLEQLKKDLAKRTVTSSAGGGMVKVTANGAMQIVKLEIEQEVVDPSDVSMLQDLIVAATNQALAEAREMINTETAALTGGISIPGLGDLLGGLGS